MFVVLHKVSIFCLWDVNCIPELHVLSKMEDLILDHTPLDINILQSIGSLTSLKTLSLYNCSLNGTLPAQGNTFTLHLFHFITSY